MTIFQLKQINAYSVCFDGLHTRQVSKSLLIDFHTICKLIETNSIVENSKTTYKI